MNKIIVLKLPQIELKSFVSVHEVLLSVFIALIWIHLWKIYTKSMKSLTDQQGQTV